MLRTSLKILRLWLNNLRKCVLRPGYAIVLMRRLFPVRAILNDREVYHVIKAWSSGTRPRRSLTDIFPGICRTDVTLISPYDRVIGWSVDIPELTALLAIIRFTGARRILEIGTHNGFTALNFAANVPDGGTVITLDLPPADSEDHAKMRERISNAVDPSFIGSQFRGTPYEGRIEQILGDSTSFDWRDITEQPFDFIFIDGSHDYSFVARDTANAIRNVKLGGVIVWHDYGAFRGVSRAVDGVAKQISTYVILGTRLAVGIKQQR